ncbi:MAG: cysteine hydrolase family protein [Lysobacter sp.]
MQHPTIRTIAGASAPQTLNPAHTALLVVDFQNEYFSGRMPIPDGADALRNTRRLIEHADRAGMPVFHIQHVTPAGSPIFAEGSDSARFHADLQPEPHHQVVRKSSVSVFPSSDIDTRLKRLDVRTLVITGLMTHACVAGAARDAVPLGYEVIVVDDACATRDLDNGDGSVLPHAVLHRAALASIADTFGDIVSTEQLLNFPLR